ncbi:MAG: YihY/virulence factor BrkB family protein [Phototrophicaceae bacterium]
MKKYLELLKITFKEWSEDDAPRLAASLSYYTAFSLAPLLLVILALLSFFFGDEAARGQIVAQFSNEIGVESAEFIQEMIQDSSEGDGGIISTIISVVMLLVGATGLFMQLQSALNEIWDIEVDSGGFISMIKKRAFSFGLLMTLAFLLLISLVINSVIASLDTYLTGVMPAFQFIVQLITLIVSFGISTALFAIIYKYMPDATIAWRDVMIGAAVTSALFTLGRFGLSLYIGTIGVSSSYGAAGSFLVILLWVYYSAQIMMFGAEFTQVYARRYGTQIIPEEGASFNVQRQLEMNNISMKDVEKELLDGNVTPDQIKKAAKESTDATPEPSSSETITEMDRPIIVGEDAKVVHFHKKQPDYTVIISSLIGVIGAAVGWILSRRASDS